MKGRPVTYPDVTAPLRERTREALADGELGGNLRAAQASWAKGRRQMAEQHDFAAMRERATAIRRDNIARLPELLARLEERVRAAGGTVARVTDSDAACRYITDLAAARGASLVAKSKSMATEEIKLNEALEEAGLRVVETDLGEWILQLAAGAPVAHHRPGRAPQQGADPGGARGRERRGGARGARGAGRPRAPAAARGVRGRRHRRVGREPGGRRDRHALRGRERGQRAGW